MYNVKTNPLKLPGGTAMERRLKELGYQGYFDPDSGISVRLAESTPAELLASGREARVTGDEVTGYAVGGARARADDVLRREEAMGPDTWMTTAEALPSMETEMGQWLAMKAKDNPDLVSRYTDDLAQILHTPEDMRALGIDNYTVRQGVGGYRGMDAAPNMIVRTGNPEDAKVVADRLGYALQQDAVPFMRVTEGAAEGTPGVRVRTASGVGERDLAAIREGTGLDYTRERLDTIDFINFRDEAGNPLSGLSDEEFVGKLTDYFAPKLDEAAIRSAFPGEAADEVIDYVKANRVPRAASDTGGAVRAEQVEKVRADPRSSYNWTQDLWAGSGATPGDPRLTRQGLEEARRRVEVYSEQFRKQHGRADPRALAALAGIGAALAAAPDAEAGAAGAFTRAASGLLLPAEDMVQKLLRTGFLSAEAASNPQAVKSAASRYQRTMDTVPAFRRAEAQRAAGETVATDSPITTTALDPESLLGKVLVPVTGDRTVTGRTITEIGGVKLQTPVEVQGGAQFPAQRQEEGLGWASMSTAAKKKQDNFDFAAERTGLEPVGVFAAMGDEAANFATPIADALIQMTQAYTVPKKFKAEFDAALKKVRPDWVGLDSTNARDQLLGQGEFAREGAGALRSAFVAEMSKRGWRDKGFPLFDDVVNAVVEPELRGVGVGDAGFSAFAAEPGAAVRPIDSHLSYDTGIPGQYLGGMESVPPEVMFPTIMDDLSRQRNRRGEPLTRPQQTGSLTMNNKLLQVADQQWLDNLMAHRGKIVAGATTSALAPLTQAQESELAPLAAQREAATPPAVRDFSDKRQQKRTFWDGYRASIAGAAESSAQILGEVAAVLGEGFGNAAGTIARSSNIMFDALDMPMRGLMGAAGAAGVLTEGGTPGQAVARGATIARQPYDQTAYELGGFVADETGSPGAATATHLAALLASPI
jgi:hypothetical protein